MLKCHMFYKIVSYSMYPTLRPGDIVICGEKREKVQIGDIVVINPRFFKENEFDLFFNHIFDDDMPIIHRIIEKKERGEKLYFKTSGDFGWRVDAASKVMERTKDYVLILYDEKNAYIPETEIMGVVLKVIRDEQICPHCHKPISNNPLEDQEILDFNLETLNKLSTLGKRFEMKLYLEKEEEEKISPPAEA